MKQITHVLLLLASSVQLVCATDIVPNPTAPGNLGTTNSPFPNVNATNVNAQSITANAITLGGVTQTNWPSGGGSAPAGTVTNGQSGVTLTGAFTGTLAGNATTATAATTVTGSQSNTIASAGQLGGNNIWTGSEQFGPMGNPSLGAGINISWGSGTASVKGFEAGNTNTPLWRIDQNGFTGPVVGMVTSVYTNANWSNGQQMFDWSWGDDAMNWPNGNYFMGQNGGYYFINYPEGNVPLAAYVPGVGEQLYTPLGATLMDNNGTLYVSAGITNSALLKTLSISGGSVAFTRNSDGSSNANITVTGGGGSSVASGTATNLSLFSAPTRLIFDGDSLTAGATGIDTTEVYAWWLQNAVWKNQTNITLWDNVAVGGTSIYDAIQRFNANVLPFAPSGGTNAFLFFWDGVNDLRHGSNGLAVFTNWQTYVSMATNAGFKVVAFTVTDSQDFSPLATVEGYRSTLDNAIRSASQSYYTLIDVAALYPLSVTNDQPDGLHFSTNEQYNIARQVDAQFHANGPTVGNDTMQVSALVDNGNATINGALALNTTTVSGTIQTNGGNLAWWQTTNGTGLTVTDSASTNTGTIMGSGTTWTTGPDAIAGHALTFNGSGYVDCGLAPAMNFGTNNFTINWCQYVNALSGSVMPISQGQANVGGWYIIENAAGAIEFAAEISGTETSAWASNSIATGQWQMITFVRSNSIPQYYVNGAAVTTTGSVTNIAATSTHLQIGEYAYTSTYNFVGSIANVSMWNTNLNAAQVAALNASTTHNSAVLTINGVGYYYHVANGVLTLTTSP